MAGTVHTIGSSKAKSIQGELEAKRDEAYAMSMGDIDDYLTKASDVVIKCRLGRHVWPDDIRNISFNDIDKDGNFIRRDRCQRCELAERVEKYAVNKIAGRLRWHRLGSQVVYHTSPDGTSYTAPSGLGRIFPRDLRDAAVTRALQGVTEAQMRRLIKQAQTGAKKVG